MEFGDRGENVMQARALGLLTAAATMSLLFLTVVGVTVVTLQMSWK
jgi:hypothetical protein